jgi:multiple sugar transport system substrate-binding protein
MSGYGMASTSKHKPEAWKLLKFLSGAEGQRWFSKTGLAQPAIVKVAESKAFLDGQKPLNKKTLLKGMKYGKWEPFAMNWRETYDGVIGPELDRVWNDTETVEQAINKISEELKKHPLKLPD